MRPVKHANTKLFERDDKERLVGEAPRHPIGIFLIIFNAVFLTVALLVGLFFALRYQDTLVDAGGSGTDLTPFIIGLVVLLLFFIVVGSAIAAYVYSQNFLVLTDQKLVLIFQKNIFARKISQLSIGDVQDVTVVQPGFLSRFFNYGTIKIETAGEMANFSFPYTPEPHEAAKVIVQAHEENLQLYGN